MPMIFNKIESLSTIIFFMVKLPWYENLMIVETVLHIKLFKDVKFWVELQFYIKKV